MQTLLTDIELDIKELKYLIDTIERDPQSPLKDVARRSIRQMHAHLDVLAQQLDAQIPVTSEERQFSMLFRCNRLNLLSRLCLKRLLFRSCRLLNRFRL
jgi:hypothetical protein